MDEYLFDKIPGLENLLENRSFEELTNSEKEIILHHMKREEYDDYHMTIVRSKALFVSEQDDIRADPATRKLLLTRVGNQKTSQKKSISYLLKSFFNFRIPAYQPGVAITVLAILFILLHNEKAETIRYLTKTDTIYLNKEIARNEEADNLKDTVRKNNSPKDKAAQTPQKEKSENAAFSYSDPPADQYIQNAYQKISMVNLRKAGRNATEDTALMKFLVSAN